MTVSASEVWLAAAAQAWLQLMHLHEEGGWMGAAGRTPWPGITSVPVKLSIALNPSAFSRPPARFAGRPAAGAAGQPGRLAAAACRGGIPAGRAGAVYTGAAACWQAIWLLAKRWMSCCPPVGLRCTLDSHLGCTVRWRSS